MLIATGIILGLMACIAVGAVVATSQKRKVIQTPEALTVEVVKNFHSLSETEIAKAERLVMGAQPHSAEIDLLYALRIAKAVEKVKSPATLASRWDTACMGAGGRGLIMGRESQNHTLVRNFIDDLCVGRLREIAKEIVTKASEQAGKRKSGDAKANAYQKAIEKLQTAIPAHDEGSTLHEAVSGLIAQLQSLARAAEK